MGVVKVQSRVRRRKKMKCFIVNFVSRIANRFSRKSSLSRWRSGSWSVFGVEVSIKWGLYIAT